METVADGSSGFVPASRAAPAAELAVAPPGTVALERPDTAAVVVDTAAATEAAAAVDTTKIINPCNYTDLKNPFHLIMKRIFLCSGNLFKIKKGIISPLMANYNRQDKRNKYSNNQIRVRNKF